MGERLHIDYETASKSDIKKVGSYNYVRHPSTRALMLGWEIGPYGGLWDIHHDQPMPKVLREATEDPSVERWAFNAAFEAGVDRHVMRLDIPIERYRCSMVLGYSMGLGGSIDYPPGTTTNSKVKVARGLAGFLLEMGAPQEFWKDTSGSDLITLFSVKGADPDAHADRWEKFCEYCIQDVGAERWLTEALLQYAPMREVDWQDWAIDQKINNRGVPIDLRLVDMALSVADQEKERLREVLAEATKLKNPNSNPQMLGYLQKQGVEIANLRAETVQQAIVDYPAEAPVMRMYQQLNKRSVSKWEAYKACAPDGRMRGAHQFRGASRTGRDAHRLVQLGNLPRGGDDGPLVAEMLLQWGWSGLGWSKQKSVMDGLSRTLRSAATASDGHTLAVSDLASIESRVVGWLSSDEEMQSIFASGKDTYKVFATWYYNIPYEAVTKAQRGFCKPPVLACAYMLSGQGLVAYAKTNGVTLELHEAERMVAVFRARFFRVREMWEWLDNAAKHVIRTREALTGYRVTLRMEGDFLTVQLPSGRKLYYRHPKVEMLPAPWDRSRKIENVTYMGHNQHTKNKWLRISTHPGKWVEQITQATAADIFWHGIRAYGHEGVVLRVHDELVVEVPEYTAQEELESLEECMALVPSWGEGLYLGAEGFLTKRYRKG